MLPFPRISIRSLGAVIITVLSVFASAQTSLAQTFPAFSAPQEQSGVQIPCAPAATYDGSKYWLAAPFNDYTQGNLEVYTSTDGVNFTEFQGIPADMPPFSKSAACSAGIVVFDGYVYVSALENSNGNVEIYRANLSQPQLGFSQVGSVGSPSGSGAITSPSMAVFDSQIYIILSTNNGYMFKITSTNGTTWTATESGLGTSGLASVSSVGLAVFGGDLYMTFQQDNSQDDAWIAKTSDGNTWTATQYTDLAYGGAPTMTVWNNELVIVFQQDNSQKHLYVAVSTNGTNLSAQEYTSTNMGTAGSVVAVGDKLTVYYKQDNSDNYLFYNTATN